MFLSVAGISSVRHRTTWSNSLVHTTRDEERLPLSALWYYLTGSARMETDGYMLSFLLNVFRSYCHLLYRLTAFCQTVLISMHVNYACSSWSASAPPSHMNNALCDGFQRLNVSLFGDHLPSRVGWVDVSFQKLCPAFIRKTNIYYAEWEAVRAIWGWRSERSNDDFMSTLQILVIDVCLWWTRLKPVEEIIYKHQNMGYTWIKAQQVKIIQMIFHESYE